MSRQQQQQRTTLFIDNIHCPSCVSGIQDILATYTLTKVHSVQDSSFPRTSIDDKADGLIARIRSTGAASSAAGSASAAALELGLGDSSDEPALTQIAVSIVDGTASFNQDPTFNLNPVIQELQAAGFTVSDHDWSDATSGSARNQHSNRHNHNGEGRGAFRSFSDLFGGGGSSNAATARRQRAHRAICKACQEEDKEAQIAASGCGGGCCGRNTLSPHSSSSSPDREKANALEKKVTNPAPAADAAAAPAPVLVETTAIVVGLSCSSCVSSIETVLTPQRVPGLKSTRVLLLDNTVIVVHDPAIFSVENLTTAINDQGFEVEDASSKPLSPAPGARGGKKKAVAQAAAAVATPAPSSAAATTGTKNASSFRPEKWSVLLSIEGMTCSSCTGTIENGLKDAQGISDVRVDLMSNSATLTVTSLGLAEDAAKHITKMGYPAQVMTVGSISTPAKKISSIQPADAKNHITTTPEKWAVLLSIEGMTCTSCTGTIENGLKGHSGVIDVKVDLMSNSATLVVTNREMAESAAEAVGELGYPAQVTSVELLSGGRAEKRQKATKIIPPGYKALFLIGGMTCSSCVNTISNDIRGIAGVSDFEVDLMAQSGSGNITDESLAQKIKEDIRDLGYEAEILKVEPLASAGDDVDGDEVEPKPRNVSIRIDGLFCEKCPPRVNKVLEEFSIKFDDLSYTPVTLDDPSATLTYIPRPPEFSLRIVKLAIQELGFTMNVLQAETLQDRAMRVQKKERQRLLIRLMVAIVFCIPTFIFGVVGPSLLSASNGFRRYLETPIAGGAARFKIALLVLSTPVQFGVGSLFYTHSYKSLRGVWRKRGGKISKRKVWLDRLFRWGSMDSLVALGTTIAWVSSLAYLALDIRGTGMSSEMGFFDTSVFLITFILAGRYLESLSKQRTGDALSELSKLRPQKGLLYDPDGTTEDIEAIFIERGDRVLVPVGSAAPLDGVLTEDSSLTAFDEASLTGESRPVGKKAGDTIYGATINAGPGAAVLKITNGDGETVIDSITLGVRNAMGKKASLERLADSITAIFVPVIVGIAVTTLLIWIVRGYSGNLPLEWLMDQERGGWLLFSIQFAVAVLVVACPCGIGLAAPTAQLVGVGIAARNGIMPNGGGEAFQAFSHIDAIIFDKTGTLTLGQFQVTATKTTDALDDARLWASLANIEQASSHPIALAVHAHANAKRESNPPPSPLRMADITEIPGKGMKATLSGGSGDKDAFEMAVGNVKLMEEVGARVSEEMSSQLLEWQNNGMSSVTVSYKSLGGTGPAVVAAAIAVVDPIRPETAYVLQDLERQGVAAYIVSGDAERTVQAVAKQLSIPVEQAIGGASPEDKKAFIEKLQGTMSDGGNQKNTGRFAGFLRSKKSKKQQTKRKLVAMVGDGVNDSIALAQADVSIALGGGSQVATSTAHFALLSDSLLSILLLQAISRSTYRRIISNFLWACVYNVVLIPIAAGAFYDLGRTKLPAVWASLAMALSSLSVVFNSLLLRYTFRVPKAVQRYRNSAA